MISGLGLRRCRRAVRRGDRRLEHAVQRRRGTGRERDRLGRGLADRERDRGQPGERQARGERVGQGDVVLGHVADVGDRDRVGDRAAGGGAHGRRAGGHGDGVDVGTVNVSVCVWVIDGLVVLVAVTVNESWVPGGGIGWPVFGTQVDAEDSRLARPGP